MIYPAMPDNVNSPGKLPISPAPQIQEDQNAAVPSEAIMFFPQKNLSNGSSLGTI